MTPVTPGRVVVLNGASSTGKTTLARAFRDRRAEAGECWLLVGIDDFFDRLPFQWMAAAGFRGPWSDDGVTLVDSCAGVTVHVGDLGRRLFAAYRRTALTWARSGFHVLVDDVTFDEAAGRDWDEVLREVAHLRVAVRCAPEVAAARESVRGDRLPGISRGTRRAHEHGVHHGVLDTTDTTVEDLVEALGELVDRVAR